MDALDKQLRDLRMSEILLDTPTDKLAQLIDESKWQLEVEDVDIVDIGSFDIHELIRGASLCLPPSPFDPSTPLNDASSI